ncbi:hypothetical protein AAC387_Pa05g2971 [Persea americana]
MEKIPTEMGETSRERERYTEYREARGECEDQSMSCRSPLHRRWSSREKEERKKGRSQTRARAWSPELRPLPPHSRKRSFGRTKRVRKRDGHSWQKERELLISLVFHLRTDLGQDPKREHEEEGGGKECLS